MRVFNQLRKTYSLLVRLLDYGTDYIRYLLEELSNSERDTGWKEGEMTLLLTAQQGTREEQQLAHARKSFWQNLMTEGK